MSGFAVCRVCLSDNARMHSIANTRLQELYENLTRIKFSSEAINTVCSICHSLLRKCCKMVDMARNTEKFLLECRQNGIELTEEIVLLLDRGRLTHNYYVTPIESITLSELYEENGLNKNNEINKNNEMNKHNELNKNNELNKIYTDSKVKEELINNVENGINNAVDVKFELDSLNISSSDSDDNVPLNTFITKQEVLDQGKGNKRQKRKYRKESIKIDAIEVKPSKQQQIEAVLARAKSLNYLNSPFKCNLCYKGFVNEVTFSNHMAKHDEMSGVYKCEVCALRYPSPRLLRMHCRSAHSRYYRCNKCAHVSQTVNQARDHERWHQGFMFDCQLCGHKFKKRTSYLTHTRLKHPTENVCNICGGSFVGENGLLLHKSKSHKRDMKLEDTTMPASRFCATCNIQFVVLEAYQRHLLTSVRHHTHNSTECIICNQNHPDYASLNEHMKMHKKKLLLPPASAVSIESMQVQLPCELCGAVFGSRSRLAAHNNRKHLGIKYSRQVVCEQCGAQFNSFGALHYHQRKHTGARPFPCLQCSKRFCNSSQLRLHGRTHSGERPYACGTCPRRFTQKAALNRHHRVHTGLKPYSCQVCFKNFSQTNSLKVHVQAVHLKMPQLRKKRPPNVINTIE